MGKRVKKPCPECAERDWSYDDARTEARMLRETVSALTAQLTGAETRALSALSRHEADAARVVYLEKLINEWQAKFSDRVVLQLRSLVETATRARLGEAMAQREGRDLFRRLEAVKAGDKDPGPSLQEQ